TNHSELRCTVRSVSKGKSRGTIGTSRDCLSMPMVLMSSVRRVGSRGDAGSALTVHLENLIAPDCHRNDSMNRKLRMTSDVAPTASRTPAVCEANCQPANGYLGEQLAACLAPVRQI